jgi:hypothetical protein
MRIRVITAALAAFAAAGADASEIACTTCTPPTGKLGYVWFMMQDASSFTCITGTQTITQNYASALAGYKADGTLGAIRFTEGGATKQLVITGGTVCTLRN